MANDIPFRQSAGRIEQRIEQNKPNEQVGRWAQAWAERFRSDAGQVDTDVHALCERIRALLDAIEGKATR
jgi:hypothetical protein